MESHKNLHRRTFIFFYPHCCLGGIETYFVELMKFYASNGVRVIWITVPDRRVFDGWKDFLYGGKIEIINAYTRGFKWFKHDELVLSSDEEIVMVAFDVVNFARSEQIKNEFKKCNINNYYVVPHFTMNAYFLERYFKNSLNVKTKRIMKSILQDWDLCGKIRFFSEKHINALEENYGIIVDEKKGKTLPKLARVDNFDDVLAEERSKRQEFRIITVGRFDFPHKGYILGLISTFAQLKNKYPQLKLDIIGYGNGENTVKELINSLEDNVANDIRILGAIAPDRLKLFFDLAHVNIGVAGAIRNGASAGLVSIPARHYCYQCEVYGYLPESIDKVLSDQPGENVDKYITDLIEMSADNYLELCRRSYDTYRLNAYKVDPWYFFKSKNRDAHEVKLSNIRDIRRIYYLVKIYNKFRSIFKASEKETVGQLIGKVK